MEPTSIASEESVAGSSLFVYVEVDIGQTFTERTKEVPSDTLIGTESFAPPTLIGLISDVLLEVKVSDPLSWYDGFAFLDVSTGDGSGGSSEPTQYWSD